MASAVSTRTGKVISVVDQQTDQRPKVQLRHLVLRLIQLEVLLQRLTQLKVLQLRLTQLAVLLQHLLRRKVQRLHLTRLKVLLLRLLHLGTQLGTLRELLIFTVNR